MSAVLELTPEMAQKLKERLQRTRPQRGTVVQLHPSNAPGDTGPAQGDVSPQTTGEEIASSMGLELVKDQHGSLRAKHMVGNRLSFPLIDSADIEDCVASNWLETHGTKGLKVGVETSMIKLRVAAKVSTLTVKTMVRVGSRLAPDGHRQYLLDLGRSDGQMVVSDHTGWVLEKNATEAFLQPDGECALPHKFESPEAAYAHIKTFEESSGVPADLRLLVCAAIVSTLRDDMAYVILECCGASGAGKTSFANAVIQAIDPNVSGRPVNCGVNKKDIAAASSMRHYLIIDNASSLKREEQDLCCQIPYGTTLSERKLYTNYGNASIHIHRPIIITSVNPAITATDLQTRRLLVPFTARRRYAKDVQPSDTDRGMLLGALLTLLVAGLKQERLAVVLESQHRMAEFAAFGEAISLALGHEAGYFSDLYTLAKRSAALDYASGDPTAYSIRNFLRFQQKLAIKAENPPINSKIRKDRGFIIHKPNGQYLAGYTPCGLRIGAKGVFQSSELNVETFKTSGFTFPETDRAMGGAMKRLISSILPDLGFETKEGSLGSKRNKETLYLFQWRSDDEHL